MNYNITCGSKKCLDIHYENKRNKISARKTKIAWPENSELAVLVWKYPLTKLGQKLGLSDNAIRKRCKKNEIALPHHGHWQKVFKSNGE